MEVCRWYSLSLTRLVESALAGRPPWLGDPHIHSMGTATCTRQVRFHSYAFIWSKSLMPSSHTSWPRFEPSLVARNPNALHGTTRCLRRRVSKNAGHHGSGVCSSHRWNHSVEPRIYLKPPTQERPRPVAAARPVSRTCRTVPLPHVHRRRRNRSASRAAQ